MRRTPLSLFARLLAVLVLVALGATALRAEEVYIVEGVTSFDE
jgi:hypothetical protein